MKKSVLAALTGALVLGASATTFAAANPFSDVPAGHWAYDAVTRLASEGIIEGYGDKTFRGRDNITRYEMAQIIARAMDKVPKGTENPDLEKLKAEFHDELENLGVRVSNLEKHADMVKWTGELRYRYWHDKRDGEDKRTNNQLQLRLFPTAEINDHWTAKARITATHNMSSDESGDAKLTFVYAQGKYGKFTFDIGKMPFYSDADDGIVVDDFFSGARILYGDKFKVKVEAGRWNAGLGDTANYQGGEVLYKNDRFNIGAAYRHFRSEGFRELAGYKDSKDANIWSIGAGYKFGDAVKLKGEYAHNSKAEEYKSGYNIELDYRGADKSKGSWGAYVAYRRIGQNVGLATTYDTFAQRTNKKGVEFGVTWSPFKNSLTQASYFHGKTLDGNDTTKVFFGRISFFF